MKAICAVVAFVGLAGRCADGELPIAVFDPPQHSSGPTVARCDAGPPPTAAEDAGTADEACDGPPGLYADGACEQLAQGVVPYTPSYPLWSDGADKERFIYLPAGSRIDTSNPNRWTFPVGTRIYKTFSLHGVKLETRLFEKLGEPAGIDSWSFVAYAWSEDQRSATLADAEGVEDVLGTDHDIPSQAQCKSCHNQPGLDIVNGFEAIALNHSDAHGWTLRRLIERGRLVNESGDGPNVTIDNAVLPGDERDQAALGYLQANCGHCHGGPTPRASLDLSAPVGMTQLSDAPAFRVGARCICLTRWTGRQVEDGSGSYELVLVPGDAARSGMVGRMSRRGPREQMPPLGTEHVDPDGLAAVSDWIDSLPPAACAQTVVCMAPPQ